MEQLVARRAHNPKVIGSSPIPAIFFPHNFLNVLFIYTFKFFYFFYMYLFF